MVRKTQKLNDMPITIIFNGNFLTEPNSPLKLKIPYALIKLVLKIALNAPKSVILQCGKNEVGEQIMPPSQYGFQIIAP